MVDIDPPPAVTPELFATWRAARRGEANPQRMTNPVWTWLARTGITAWLARDHFGQGSGGGSGGGSGWCNERYGQSVSTLPDGRVLAVAGEHEDHYDPDFFIYNDVIVTGPDGSVEIYGYPPDVFPPTDHHSATLAGDHLYLVGCLGYPAERGDRTRVLRLDVDSLSVEPLVTRGPDPGWLWGHSAVLDADGRTLRVSGGEVELSVRGERVIRYLADDHALDLDRLEWTRTTDRRWRQYGVIRAEGFGRLWELSQLAECAAGDTELHRTWAAEYRAELSPDVDLAAWHARYRPPVAHEPLPGDDEAPSTHRIRVDGLTVRYVEGRGGVQVVVEGPLPAKAEAALVEDLRAKLSRAEAAAYVVTSLDPDPAPF